MQQSILGAGKTGRNPTLAIPIVISFAINKYHYSYFDAIAITVLGTTQCENFMAPGIAEMLVFMLMEGVFPCGGTIQIVDRIGSIEIH